jgi:two-component system sensor histidine kinase HydH
MTSSPARRVRPFLGLPPWLKLILILGVIVLGTLLATRDLDRERRYLEDLFLQKGEVLIRSLSTASRMGWTNLDSVGDLASFMELMDSQDVLYIATTNLNGGLISASVPLSELADAPFANLDPPDSFQPPVPHFREQGRADGRKGVFWVYRPLWFTFGEAPPRPGNHRGPTHHGPPPPWDSPLLEKNVPEIQMRDRPRVFIPPIPRDPRVAVYCWVGFDREAFAASERAAKTNSILFIGLMTLASLAGVLALFWAHSWRLARRQAHDTSALALIIFDRLPVGLILTDNEGRVTFANPAALKIAGLRQNDFRGQKLSALTFGTFPQEEELSGVETDLNFRGGLSARLSITGGPVLDRQKVKVGRVILLADLGELGRLKAELAQKDRLATLGSMARGLAHEIRNPLGAIKGLTQHLLSRDSTTREKEALAVILSSVDRLAGTITDFLEFARPTELKPEPLALGSLLQKIHSLIAHDADSEKVTLDLTLPPEPLYSMADEALLSQAFLNLYLNAIQATSQNPPELPRLLTVALTSRFPGQALICFTDNGPGFGEEQLSRPFVPYFTSKAQGTGLGLALVKKTVEAHDGQVLLGNHESGGAMVTVVLPLLASPPPPPDGEEPA